VTLPLDALEYKMLLMTAYKTLPISYLHCYVNKPLKWVMLM